MIEYYITLANVVREKIAEMRYDWERAHKGVFVFDDAREYELQQRLLTDPWIRHMKHTLGIAFYGMLKKVRAPDWPRVQKTLVQLCTEK
jgi:hypothetical protein